MSHDIPPSQKALTEALELSDEILRNIELRQSPLSSIALKVGRLARLLNDFDMQKIIGYEVGGYPSTASGLMSEDWRLGVVAGRKYEEKDWKTGEAKQYVYTNSIEELEETVRIAEHSLAAASDPDVLSSSANPNQWVQPQVGNQMERQRIRTETSVAARRLASRRAMIYEYALGKHYELKFSGIADDVFSRIRERVDTAIGRVIPEAVKRLTAAYENLRSENSEDWSNAVHSCRRILQDLADAVFPSTDEEKIVEVDGSTSVVKLGKEQYINRIIAFVEKSADSERFEDLVGSHLKFLGERLDSVFKAAQKGSHDTIVRREEADRYVVFTYLLVGDILSLGD